MAELKDKELVYAGNTWEFQEYLRMHNKTNRDAIFISDPNTLRHAANGAEVKVFGQYQARMDYGQVVELCKRFGLHFKG